ncbi:hypothetical protein H0255_20800 [Pectobacterium versatile]|uniref:ORC-CDC6 family AAA ATPase n=2 Tax=Pectobacterium TaxID=122277 RepID=UPI000CDF03D1|nr:MULTISPECIES: hypothetical protein [Pectobacterium]MBA0165573.1 hypothetical protein [Pectobacterium versatile]MBN3062369.1 hypothetical protein [Pectobacterium versatile]MBQ4763464.1 hypothetical protein [Pectobacterium versatile]MBQ4781000.1 hypothetical protein [Pectobacterium versatile]MBQ4785557.1 hypothetical protein [Pectobacterium versatile]
MNYSELSEIFESSNARSLNANQLTSEFIWTKSFDLLFSRQNQVILGSRGSGKTALIKMLSHDNLSKLAENYSKAREIINSKEFIATYVPLRVEWVNSLNNFEDKKEEYFIWSLNLSLCAKLLDTIRSCINSYIDDEIERLFIENKICKNISELWFTDKEYNNLNHIRNELEKIEYKKNLAFNKSSMNIKLSEDEEVIGINFHSTLFKPFEFATRIVKKSLSIPSESKWIVCIDEAEFLTKSHHKTLNTFMRSANELVFKITTMPYRHHTLDTDVDANINIGHDLEYVYIDKLGTSHSNQQESDIVIQEFAEKLFINRLRFHGKNEISLEALVGKSILTQSTPDIAELEYVMNLIKSNCNIDTIKRAKELYENDRNKLDDSIIRKLRGLLLLREEYNNKSGNSSSTLYSGVAIISRCSDGNPRRLFRLFNHLLSDIKGKNEKISNAKQSERLKSYSYRELEVIKFEKDGITSFEFINKIGNYFKNKNLVEKIGTDTPQSFTIDKEISDENWNSIKTAVDLGLIYPYVKKDRNEKSLFPSKEGRFVLANCLAPNFNLFPRIGKSIRFHHIFSNKNTSIKENQLELFNNED